MIPLLPFIHTGSSTRAATIELRDFQVFIGCGPLANLGDLYSMLWLGNVDCPALYSREWGHVMLAAIELSTETSQAFLSFTLHLFSALHKRAEGKGRCYLTGCLHTHVSMENDWRGVGWERPS